MKLTDKSFYSQKKTAAQEEPQDKRFLTAEELFDVIAQFAQDADNEQLRRKLDVLVNSGALPREEAMRILQQNQTVAPAPAQAMGPMMPTGPEIDDGVPMEEKVQNYKSIGLNDQQVEQVMKMAQQDWDDVQPVIPSAPTAPVQQAPVAPQDPAPQKDVSDLMSPEKSVEEKQKVMLSFMAYLSKLQSEWSHLYNEIQELKAPYSDKGNPASKQELAALAHEKKRLQSKLKGMQVQISRAGSMWKKLIKLFGQDQIPRSELIDWLGQMVKQMGRPDSMAQPMKPKAPQITDEQAKPLIEKNKEKTKEDEKKKEKPAGLGGDNLSEEEPEGTGKIGQAAPPSMPGGGEGGPPMPPPPGGTPDGGGELGMDPGLVEEKMDDPRSLEEVLEDLEKDVAAIKEKVEGGETMLDGAEVEPVHTDSGSNPAPPPMIADKVAVDDNAKEYYHDYYGEYGDQMTEDRVAEIVDVIDEVAAAHKVALSHEQFTKIADFLSEPIRGEGTYYAKATSNPDFARIADKILVNWLIKTGAANADLYPVMRPTLFVVALSSSSPAIKQKFASYVDNFEKVADKMKQPKIKGQPDDMVDVEEWGEDSDDGVPAAHMEFEVSDKEVSGAYLKLTIKWDGDEMDRSDEGLKHAVISFVKGLESQKEFLDYGLLGGNMTFDEFDPEAGMAVVSVRTKKPGDAPMATT